MPVPLGYFEIFQAIEASITGMIRFELGWKLASYVPDVVADFRIKFVTEIGPKYPNKSQEEIARIAKGSAKNHAIDFKRRKINSPYCNLSTSDAAVREKLPAAEPRREARLDWMKIEKSLEEREVRVLRARYLLGMGADEIAATILVSPHHVRRIIRELRTRVRQEFTEYVGPKE